MTKTGQLIVLINIRVPADTRAPVALTSLQRALSPPERDRGGWRQRHRAPTSRRHAMTRRDTILELLSPGYLAARRRRTDGDRPATTLPDAPRMAVRLPSFAAMSCPDAAVSTAVIATRLR